MTSFGAPSRGSLLAVLAVLTLAPPLGAQSHSESRLVFTVFGGVTHHGQLWSIPRQPLSVVFLPQEFDTLRLRRRITTGPTVGVTATLFRSSNWGIQAEAAYLGIRLDDTCDLLFAHTDVQNRAEQLCNDVSQQIRIASTTTFMVGGVRRFFSRASASPYVRVAAGLAVRASSVVAVSGRYTWVTSTGTLTTSHRPVIEDRHELRLGPTAGAGAGVVFALSPAYRVRLEVRDLVLSLDRPVGPADELLAVETESTLRHFPSLVMGVDIVLEQRRGRRY